MTSIVIPRIIRGFCNPKAPQRWTMGIRARLPEHYRRRVCQMEEDIALGRAKANYYEPEPGIWKPGKFKDTLVPVINRPIPVVYPPEADLGLWGGEGIVKGYLDKHKYLMPSPKLFTPVLKKAILYSEILDVHMHITVTESALMQIDDAFGFDFYILKTPEVDLHSNLALKIKRKMLEALMDKSLYPDDPAKREKIYNRYKQYMTYSRDELEWLGLSEQEAIAKQEAIEREENRPRPLKDVFTEHLMKEQLMKASESQQDEPLEEVTAGETQRKGMFSWFKGKG